MIHTRTVSKQSLPNVTAQIFWLKNRKRDVWKDNHDRSEIEREKLEMDKRKVDTGPAEPIHFTFSVEEGTTTVEEALG